MKLLQYQETLGYQPSYIATTTYLIWYLFKLSTYLDASVFCADTCRLQGRQSLLSPSCSKYLSIPASMGEMGTLNFGLKEITEDNYYFTLFPGAILYSSQRLKNINLLEIQIFMCCRKYKV